MIELERSLDFPATVAYMAMASLIQMGEPYSAEPASNGWWRIKVRIDVRQTHIKRQMWEQFPDLRDALIKAGFAKPHAATKLVPYEPELGPEDLHGGQIVL